jgi:hypothetical protein
MKGVKISLYIIAILLFVSSYSICDLFYYNEEIRDIKKWWNLRSNIYAIIIMLVFYASLIGTKGVLRLILSIGVGLCISNVIDKVYFNVLDFTYTDIIMILLTICISLYDYLNTYKL